MTRNHHDLNWYDHEVQRLRNIVRTTYGVELNDREMKAVRDEIYRVVNDAKVRANAIAVRG